MTHVFLEVTLSREYSIRPLDVFGEVSSLKLLAVNTNASYELFGVLYGPMGPRLEEYLRVFKLLAQGGLLESYNAMGPRG